MLALRYYRQFTITVHLHSALFYDYLKEICDNYQCNHQSLYLNFFKQPSRKNKISYWRILQVLEKFVKELSLACLWFFFLLMFYFV